MNGRSGNDRRPPIGRPDRSRSRARVARRPGRTLPKPAGIAIVAVVGIALVSGFALVVFRVARSGSLPNLELASTDVGALSDEELRAAVEDVHAERRIDRITIRRPPAGVAPAASIEVTGAEVGYEIDTDGTVERILARGRQANPITALGDHLRATFGAIAVAPVDGFGSSGSGTGLDEVTGELSSPPFYGGVRFVDGEPRPRYPEPGVLVSRSHLTTALVEAIRAPGSDEVTTRGRPVDPSTDEDDVDELVGRARRAVDGPVELTRAGSSITFSPGRIARAIRATTMGEDEDVELDLRISTRAVTDILGERSARFETPPADASFEPAGDSVTIVKSRPGFEVVPKRVARQLLGLALREGPAEARMRGRTKAPDFTTADARALEIEEQVSTFTTYHACCEPRVENIHRIADIVDGAIVEPGHSFSLNDYVGPRTTANGFIGAPSIRDGEFVEEVGGGISQFATTTFNAIFFGGYDFLVYQPHSYFISRYPPGREATISTPAPDLAFRNDSDAGVYIDTSYSDTSITVSLYGNTEVEVDSVTGPRQNIREPVERCRENRALSRGEEVVVQEGITGFDIVVRRVFSNSRPDEVFTTEYDMQPRIVERRRCARRGAAGKDRKGRFSESSTIDRAGIVLVLVEL